MKYVILYTGEVLYASLGRHWSSRLSQVATGGMKNLCLNILARVQLRVLHQMAEDHLEGVWMILDWIQPFWNQIGYFVKLPYILKHLLWSKQREVRMISRYNNFASKTHCLVVCLNYMHVIIFWIQLDRVQPKQQKVFAKNVDKQWRQ